MDAQQFDVMTKSAAGGSRRRVFLGLAAGLLGGLSLVRVQPGAAQEYDERGQRCLSNADCNAPCRYCDREGTAPGRCVYACDNKTEVCNASLTDPTSCLDDSGNPITKGCCVPR